MAERKGHRPGQSQIKRQEEVVLNAPNPAQNTK